MSYMERNFELRIDPRKLVPGAQSVITLLLNYFPSKKQQEDAPKIAKYAYGNDYHDSIRSMMESFLFELRQAFGDVQGRGFIDSAPVLERSWASKSGLGWVGKNGNLIHKGMGSFFFIATLITDLQLSADDPFTKDFCGSCTRCLDACPTGAIVSPTVVDGSKCISYLTIELKDEWIDPSFQERMEGWMFGCDICQDVCPWNRFARPHQQAAFEALPQILELGTSEWKDMEEDLFRSLFKHSPLKRSKWKGIQRNLHFVYPDPG